MAISTAAAQEVVPDARAVSFTRTGTEGSFTVYKVDYPVTPEITIMTQDDPGNYEKETVRVFVNEISRWDGLTVKNVKFIFRMDSVEINLVPQSLVYNENEYTHYLPAGINFIHTHFTMYDFRLVKDNYFIRIRGQYFSPDMLLGRMEEAVSDPAKYISVHDPEFMVRQIADINVRDTRQDGELAGLKSDLERLSEAHEKLDEAYRELLKDFENLRYAYASETKRGIYGRKTPIPRQEIDAVLSARKARPNATLDDIYSEMRDKGIKITKAKIAVILNAYLGEYPE